MAKMKIYEIARSIQQQDKNIKSSDLVRLLNENGFEVKGANSNIEDAAIAFLMKYFTQKKTAKEEDRKLEKAAAAVKKQETAGETADRTAEKAAREEADKKKAAKPKAAGDAPENPQAEKTPAARAAETAAKPQRRNAGAAHEDNRGYNRRKSQGIWRLTASSAGTPKNAAAERESLSALKRPRAVSTESNRSRRTPVRETAERTRKRPAVIARAARRR